MSHFTHMKTRFQNLFYLEKALNRLNFVHKQEQQNTTNSRLYHDQSNGYEIEFCWNGQKYELVLDMSFWEQPYPIESLIDKIAQEYAEEVIVGESRKMGFQSISYQQNRDHSNTLIFERWRTEKFTSFFEHEKNIFKDGKNLFTKSKLKKDF